MRLLVVSNRLPITVVEKEGAFSFKQSAGGLVSGLSAYLDSLKGSSFTEKSEYVWVGWPGITVSDEIKEDLKSRALSEVNAYSVFLSEEVMDKFYHGFCNKTIWPLFHYFPSYTMYDEDCWAHYRLVNESFCDAVLDTVRPGDIVWVHDYHLMLLPRLLRGKGVDAPVGFFLHIPFPSFEVFRLLPREWRTEILEGILGADLVGFHTYDYTQYFLRCVLRILGYEHDIGKLVVNNRLVKVETFPMGIDFQKFHSAVSSPEVEQERARLKSKLAGVRVILSVDRLDYSKGIINRLQGFEIFLEKNPEWRGKVLFILVIVPSRIGVEHYQQIKKQIEELVGRINGVYGGLKWTPILYHYGFFPFEPLVALYSASDVALITPLRDGMNLVAKEYVATRTEGTGVLILSEMAGAAKELGEAIIINPNYREEIAGGLKQALEMPAEEQVSRNQIMQTRLMRYDVVRWANDFIQELLSVKEEQKRFDARLLGPAARKQLLNDFNKAGRRLILLDYDGTLVPFAEYPYLAKPGKDVLEIIRSLSNDARNEVVLISGRDRTTLQTWFGSLEIALVAEHGVWVREKNKDWKMIKHLTNDWKPKIRTILETYTDRLPDSLIEEKEFAIAWHYRAADPELSSILAKELVDDLVHFTANIDIQVLQGSKVVEVRNSGVNKGSACLHFISRSDLDFILAIGDDWTDEDLFKVVPEVGYSIRVGMTSSHARFNLHSHKEVMELLAQMTRASENV